MKFDFEHYLLILIYLLLNIIVNIKFKLNTTTSYDIHYVQLYILIKEIIIYNMQYLFIDNAFRLSRQKFWSHYYKLIGYLVWTLTGSKCCNDYTITNTGNKINLIKPDFI